MRYPKNKFTNQWRQDERKAKALAKLKLFKIKKWKVVAYDGKTRIVRSRV